MGALVSKTQPSRVDDTPEGDAVGESAVELANFALSAISFYASPSDASNARTTREEANNKSTVTGIGASTFIAPLRQQPVTLTTTARRATFGSPRGERLGKADQMSQQIDALLQSRSVIASFTEVLSRGNDDDDAGKRTASKLGGLPPNLASRHDALLLYSDEAMESEFVVFFYASRRNIAIAFAVATFIAVGYGLNSYIGVAKLVYVGIDVVCLVTWAVCSIVCVVLKQKMNRLANQNADETAASHLDIQNLFLQPTANHSGGSSNGTTARTLNNNSGRRQGKGWTVAATGSSQSPAKEEHHLTDDIKRRKELRSNARMHEVVVTFMIIANLSATVAFNGTQGDCSYVPEERRLYDCRGSIQTEAAFVMIVIAEVFFTPVRFPILLIVTLVLSCIYFGVIFWDPIINPDRFYYIAQEVVMGTSLVICLVSVWLRERRSREEFEQYVERHLRSLEVEDVRRQTEATVAAEMPLAAVRSGALESTIGGSWFLGEATCVCALSLDGFTKWSALRGPCDTVEVLQHIIDRFDAIRSALRTPEKQWNLMKYHSLGDAYIVVVEDAPKSSADGSAKNTRKSVASSKLGGSGGGSTSRHHQEGAASTNSAHGPSSSKMLPAHVGVDEIAARAREAVLFGTACCVAGAAVLRHSVDSYDHWFERNSVLTPKAVVEHNANFVRCNSSNVKESLHIRASVALGHVHGVAYRRTKTLSLVGSAIDEALSECTINQQWSGAKKHIPTISSKSFLFDPLADDTSGGRVGESGGDAANTFVLSDDDMQSPKALQQTDISQLSRLHLSEAVATVLAIPSLIDAEEAARSGSREGRDHDAYPELLSPPVQALVPRSVLPPCVTTLLPSLGVMRKRKLPPESVLLLIKKHLGAHVDAPYMPFSRSTRSTTQGENTSKGSIGQVSTVLTDPFSGSAAQNAAALHFSSFSGGGVPRVAQSSGLVEIKSPSAVAFDSPSVSANKRILLGGDQSGADENRSATSSVVSGNRITTHDVLLDEAAVADARQELYLRGDQSTNGLRNQTDERAGNHLDVAPLAQAGAPRSAGDAPLDPLIPPPEDVDASPVFPIQPAADEEEGLLTFERTVAQTRKWYSPFSSFIFLPTEELYKEVSTTMYTNEEVVWSAVSSLIMTCSLTALSAYFGSTAPFRHHSEEDDAAGSLLWFVVGAGLAAILLTLASFQQLTSFLQRVKIPRFLSLGEHVSLKYLVFTSLSDGAAVCYCAAIILTPIGNPIGDSQTIWLYIAANDSLQRPNWSQPMVMWLRDAALCVTFFLRTYKYGTMFATTRMVALMLEMAVLVFCFVARVLMDQASRDAFATDLHTIHLRNELEEDYRRLEDALRVMAPEGMAAALIERSRIQRKKANNNNPSNTITTGRIGRRSRSMHPSEQEELDDEETQGIAFAAEKIHMFRSTSHATAAREVAFFVIQVQPSTHHITVYGSAALSTSSSAVGFSRQARGSTTALHTAPKLISTNKTTHALLLTHDTIVHSIQNLSNVLKPQQGVIQVMKVIGDTTVVVIPPKLSNTAMVAEAQRTGVTPQDFDELRCAAAICCALEVSKALQGKQVLLKCVAGCGPLVGAVIGKSAVSYEYYGPAMTAAMLILRELEWGRGTSVAVTSRCVVFAEMAKLQQRLLMESCGHLDPVESMQPSTPIADDAVQPARLHPALVNVFAGAALPTGFASKEKTVATQSDDASGGGLDEFGDDSLDRFMLPMRIDGIPPQRLWFAAST